jgi:hypothetical protein
MPLDATAIIKQKLGPIVKPSVMAGAKPYAADFVDGAYVGDAFPVGTTLEDFCTREFIAKHRPHWLSDEVALGDLITGACDGGPKRPVDLKTRAALLAKVGPERYAAILQEYGATTTRNGMRPDKSKSDASKNPWAPSYKGDRIAAQTAVIRGMGTAVAASMAKSAGVTLGGQPLRG